MLSNFIDTITIIRYGLDNCMEENENRSHAINE